MQRIMAGGLKMSAGKRLNAVDGALLGYLDDLLGVMDERDEPTAVDSGTRTPEASAVAVSVCANETTGRVDSGPTVTAASAYEAVQPAAVLVETKAVLNIATLTLPVIPDEVEDPVFEQTGAAAIADESAVALIDMDSRDIVDTHAAADSAEGDIEAVASANTLEKPLGSRPAEIVPVSGLARGDLSVVDAPDVQKLAAAQALPSLNWHDSAGVDCLLFTVCGLKLAIPLPMLGGVHQVSDKVTPLFGQAAWSLGIWQGDKGKLTIIDSALLIMPERGKRLADEGFEYFIQLDRSPWALACQNICDTVRLRQDAVRWRGDASKRPWLAGTVIAEMCALIDVPGLLGLLEQQRRQGLKHSLSPP
jgi:purine-binding chemotaxis protein CheW